jgi:hypothetical protein
VFALDSITALQKKREKRNSEIKNVIIQIKTDYKFNNVKKIELLHVVCKRAMQNCTSFMGDFLKVSQKVK